MWYMKMLLNITAVGTKATVVCIFSHHWLSCASFLELRGNNL